MPKAKRQTTLNAVGEEDSRSFESQDTDATKPTFTDIILERIGEATTRAQLATTVTAYTLEKLVDGEPDERFNKGEYAALIEAYDDRCFYFREHEPIEVTQPDVTREDHSSPVNQSRRETSTRTIYEPLTDAQLIESATKQNALIAEAASLTSEMKSAMSDFKQRIAGLESAASRLGYEITARRRKVEVETEEQFDFDAGAVETVRTDTGEVLSSRAMTIKERQRPLPVA